MGLTYSHAQGELLAQSRPSVTTAVTLFNNTAMRVEVTLLTATVIRTAAGNVNIDVYHDDDGTTYNDDTLILTAQKAVNGDAVLFQAQHPGSGIMIKPGGSIGIKIGTANEANFSLYGISETLADRIRGGKNNG